MAGPTIRAAFFHSNLEALAALGEDESRRVLARLPPQLLQEVEEAARVAWLPIEHDVALTEAIAAELGRDALRAWSRDGFLRSADSPILAPMIRSVRAIFGITPHSILRRVPYAWPLLFRDCGTMEYAEAGDRAASLVLRGAPAVITRSAAYLDGMSGGLEAAVILGGQRGRAQVVGEDGARTVRFSFSW